MLWVMSWLLSTPAHFFTREYVGASVRRFGARKFFSFFFPFFFNTSFLLHAVCFTRGCCPSYSLSFVRSFVRSFVLSSFISSGLVKNKTLWFIFIYAPVSATRAPVSQSQLEKMRKLKIIKTRKRCAARSRLLAFFLFFFHNLMQFFLVLLIRSQSSYSI